MRNQVIFDDYDIPTMTFQITKAGSRNVNQQIQTDFKAMEVGTDAVLTEEKNVQANMNQPIAGESIYYVSPEDDEINKRLMKFLRKTIPVLDREIQESSMQIAYQNYDPDSHSLQDETKVVTTLENLGRDTGGMYTSDIAWNYTGTLLTVGYSEIEHSGSCNHKSMICCWNLYKKGVQNASPQLIETDGCISCLSFHPARSSILACGTFSGEIYLYDLQREDDNLMAKTSINDYFHREIVTKLAWWEQKLPGSKQIAHNLLSLSTDGKILVWELNLNQKKPLLQFPLKGFSMLRKKANDTLPVGALTMQESNINRNSFIIGSEGGSLLQATLTDISHQTKAEASINVRKGFNYNRNVYPFLINVPPKKLPDVLNSLETYCTNNKTTNINTQTILQAKIQKGQIYPNCISFAYQALVSPVTSISTNEYGLMTVNGYEGFCKIYEQLNKESLQTIDGGFQVLWLTPTKLAGFFGDEWMVTNWLTGEIINRIPIVDGIKWARSGQLVAIACDTNKVKIVKVDGMLFERQENEVSKIRTKISQTKGQ